MFGFVIAAASIAAADVQQRQCIAHTAFRQTGDQLSSVLVDFDLLMSADIFDPLSDDLRTDAPKVKPLTAGENGCGNFVYLGGCQNKNDMFRRFLHDLEQRIEGADAEHVSLVDDVHPVFGDRRSEVCFLAQLTDVVYTVVAGSVDFGDIQHRTVVDSFADVADAAGIAVVLIGAVDRLGDNFGAGGFAGAAGTGEQIRMSDPAAGNFLL